MTITADKTSTMYSLPSEILQYRECRLEHNEGEKLSDTKSDQSVYACRSANTHVWLHGPFKMSPSFSLLFPLTALVLASIISFRIKGHQNPDIWSPLFHPTHGDSSFLLTMKSKDAIR